MGPTNYTPRHSNYQPLRDQEQQAARETTERTTSDRTLIEPHRNDRSLAGMPGGPDRGDLVTNQTYANAQVRMSHAQRMQAREMEQAAAVSKERTPVQERVAQNTNQQRENVDARTPVQERVQENASQQRETPQATVERSQGVDRTS